MQALEGCAAALDVAVLAFVFERGEGGNEVALEVRGDGLESSWEEGAGAGGRRWRERVEEEGGIVEPEAGRGGVGFAGGEGREEGVCFLLWWSRASAFEVP